MRLKKLVSSSLLLILFLSAIPAQAEVEIINKSEPVPFEGLLLDKDAAVKTAEKLKDGMADSAYIETLQAEKRLLYKEIDEFKAAIQAYKEAAEKDKEARIREDERFKVMAEMDARLAKALELNDKAIANFQKSAEMSLLALEKAQKHIEKLEKYRLIAMILGPLSFAAGLFIGVPH